jgi:hypothetical protein
MCDWWLRLCAAEIDLFIERLDGEKDGGSGWLDLGLQFRHWARGQGFGVGV